MTILLTTFKKILFWSYDRGTWQYDILCVLILAFIFLSPNRLFHPSKPLMHKSSPPGSEQSVSRPTAPRNGVAAIQSQPKGGTQNRRGTQALAGR